MRKNVEETAETRKRILSAAKAEFMRNGIGATGVADLMKAAGLTHGGFYRHFSSKAELVSECIRLSAQMLVESLSDNLQPKQKSAKMKAIVSGYLSSEHRADFEGGCPLASVGSELTRGNEVIREGASSAVNQLLSLLENQLDGTSRAKHQKAVAMLSTMVGALSLSRMVDDKALSDEFLAGSRQNVLRLADAS